MDQIWLGQNQTENGTARIGSEQKRVGKNRNNSRRIIRDRKERIRTNQIRTRRDRKGLEVGTDRIGVNKDMVV